jgi:hypothetical protein
MNPRGLVMGERPTKRALVIGARGVLGALTVDAFAGAGWTVRRGARRPRPGDVEIDLDRPDSVAAALDERELVVNTVPHPDLLAERHILEHGGCLINISALPAAASRSLRATAAGARGTVMMNAGLAPGVTTLVAADLLRLHPDARELEMVLTMPSTTPSGSARGDFVHRGLTAVARHRAARVPLPMPFGERVCIGFAEGDAGWLGGVAEGRLVRLYVCIAEPSVHERLLALNRAGEINTLRRSEVASSERAIVAGASDEPVAHWIAAVRGGRRLRARIVECRGEYLHAARAAVVFAGSLLAPDRPGGCVDPEEICTLGGVEAELRAAGITVTTRIDP